MKEQFIINDKKLRLQMELDMMPGFCYYENRKFWVSKAEKIECGGMCQYNLKRIKEILKEGKENGIELYFIGRLLSSFNKDIVEELKKAIN